MFSLVLVQFRPHSSQIHLSEGTPQMGRGNLLNHIINNSAIHCPIVLKFGTLMHMCPTSVQAEIG